MIRHNPMKNYPNPFYERRIIDRSLSIEECRRLFLAALQADPFVRKYYTLFVIANDDDRLAKQRDHSSGL